MIFGNFSLVCLCVCLSVYLCAGCVCVSVYAFVCLFFFLSVCLCVSLSTHQPVSSSLDCPSLRPSVILTIARLFICLFVTVIPCISVYLSVCFSSKYAHSDLFSNCNCSMSYVKMTFVVSKKETFFNIITYFKLECV